MKKSDQFLTLGLSCLVILTAMLAGCGAGQNTESAADESSGEDLSGVSGTDESGAGDQDGDVAAKEYDARYLGVVNGETQTRADVLAPGSQVYHFQIDGVTRGFSIEPGNYAPDDFKADSDGDGIDDYLNVNSLEQGGYPIQNALMVGGNYRITVNGGTVTEARALEETGFNFDTVIPYEPGTRTVKNLLSAMFAPMGKTLYVFGGGWDYQDKGGSFLTTKIGLSDTWAAFYGAQNADFYYHGIYYPANGWNQFSCLGLDCTGYIGWALYNTLQSSSDETPSLVVLSRNMARTYAERYGFGTWEHIPGGSEDEGYCRDVISRLLPGDMVSMPGHAYMVLGTCGDGSLVIMHSTVTRSVTGVEGGGVQLSAISPAGNEDTSCEAYQLVNYYMSRYFPDWTLRYPPVVKPRGYLIFPDENPETGLFHWTIGDSGLFDPEGYRNMSAAEILRDLFGE